MAQLTRRQVATAREFGVALCRAAGLDPDNTRRFTLIVEPGGLVTIEAELMPTPEEVAAITAELNTLDPSKWKDY